MIEVGVAALLVIATTACSSIAIKKPLQPMASSPLTINYCAKSTAEMNILDKRFSKAENETRFNEAVQDALTDIDRHLVGSMPGAPHFVFNKMNQRTEATASADKSQTLQLKASLHEAERKTFKDLNSYLTKELQ